MLTDHRINVINNSSYRTTREFIVRTWGLGGSKILIHIFLYELACKLNPFILGIEKIVQSFKIIAASERLPQESRYPFLT